MVSRIKKSSLTNERGYGMIFFDYRNLTLELWKIPATRYILGGVAFTSLVPVILGALKRNPQIRNFLRKNVEDVEEKFEKLGKNIDVRITDFRTSIDDQLIEDRY